ncbi:MAG: helix-turn-helix domain-containing protein [Clostridium sp.]|nr:MULTISPECIES: helix-turn-helix domain-containing protein [Clostridium]MDU4477864.1 helix-turn-helix domain-containing protein [Clostridium sp.]
MKCRKYCFNSHKKLREKIEDDNKNPKYIETVWGVGYKINQ